mgnify:FL=1
MSNTPKENPNPLEDLFIAVKDYMDLRIDQIKLHLAENMAKTYSRILSAIVCLLLGGIAFSFIAVAYYKWISALLLTAAPVYHEFWASIITAATVIILLVMVLLFREKLLLGSSIRMFIRMFFEAKDQDENGSKK